MIRSFTPKRHEDRRFDKHQQVVIVKQVRVINLIWHVSLNCFVVLDSGIQFFKFFDGELHRLVLLQVHICKPIFVNRKQECVFSVEKWDDLLPKNPSEFRNTLQGFKHVNDVFDLSQLLVFAQSVF